MNSPIQMLKSIMSLKKGNPEQIIQEMIGNNSNPMLSNLSKMAKDGDSKGVEQFARNLFKESGRDFDKEFSEFMNSMK